jgi:5'-nucleotidase / UDP-sugar diphosphatase
MHLTKSLIFVLFLFICGTVGFTVESRLILLHTNDVHSWFAERSGRLSNGERVQLGGVAVLKTVISQYREENPDAVLYLDAGDLFQGAPISTLTAGQSSVDVMNFLRPDAFVIGNHEFDYGVENLQKVMLSANFDVLMANVRKTDGTNFFPAESNHHISGLRIKILGLTSDELEHLCAKENLQGLILDSSVDYARQWLESTAGQADLRIALSHRGYVADSLLAMDCPGFDIIVGGHSHTLLDHPRKINQSWVVQSGDFGRYLGVDTLWVDKDKGTLRVSGYSLPILGSTAEADEELELLIIEQEARVNDLLAEEIAILQADFVRSMNSESNIGNWICSSIREYLEADVCIWNSGGIRKDMLGGSFTLRDVWEIVPFGNELLIGEFSGSQILNFFTIEMNNHEFMQYDGLRMNRDRDGILQFITINGQKLISDKKYKFIISDFVWGRIADLDTFVSSGGQVTNSGLLDRDILIKMARKQKLIKPVLDGR